MKEQLLPITVNQNLDEIKVKEPTLIKNREGARKSVHSAVNNNARGKNPRYIKTMENGTAKFSLNKDFKE